MTSIIRSNYVDQPVNLDVKDWYRCDYVCNCGHWHHHHHISRSTFISLYMCVLICALETNHMSMRTLHTYGHTLCVQYFWNNELKTPHTRRTRTVALDNLCIVCVYTQTHDGVGVHWQRTIVHCTVRVLQSIKKNW